MIYLKRFCFVVISFISILFGAIGTFIEIILYPIWGTICYIITGDNGLDSYEFSHTWNIFIKFLDWYSYKFGPE